jgi:hypothetical protein
LAPKYQNKAVSLTSQGLDRNENVPLVKRGQILNTFSDFCKLVGIIAWCKRFANKCRKDKSSVLTLIEACLNSQPITPLPESPSELEALTPGHFLIGSDRCETKENRLSQWQRVEQIRQHFWKRWSQEYLTELQHRTKWKITNQQHLSAGTIVLVQEDNLPPLQWRLGRIEALHPSKDKLVRVVSAKTKVDSFKSAVQKISVLPIDTDAL